MKTEKEIREKYEEMLKHTELLMDKVRNPDKYHDVNIENIKEYIKDENEQHQMNALINWVLDIKTEKQKEVVWPIRMSQELKDKFKTYCDNNGFSMNKLIKTLIEKEINYENKKRI